MAVHQKFRTGVIGDYQKGYFYHIGKKGTSNANWIMGMKRMGGRKFGPSTRVVEMSDARRKVNGTQMFYYKSIGVGKGEVMYWVKKAGTGRGGASRK